MLCDIFTVKTVQSVHIVFYIVKLLHRSRSMLVTLGNIMPYNCLIAFVFIRTLFYYVCVHYKAKRSYLIQLNHLIDTMILFIHLYNLTITVRTHFSCMLNALNITVLQKEWHCLLSDNDFGPKRWTYVRAPIVERLRYSDC